MQEVQKLNAFKPYEIEDTAELDHNEGTNSEISEDLDEVLELRLNKTKRPRSYGEDLENGDMYTTVLTQRLHREPTTRTKRAQKMQAAYFRSMGLASHTPNNAGYAKVDRPNGSRHWTIRR